MNELHISQNDAWHTDRVEKNTEMEVPYFSQCESRDLIADVLAEGIGVLARDPLWRQSGAQSIEEYVRWAPELCGMACLKMILAARTGKTFTTLGLARECAEFGGYVVGPDSIKGLIYAPFVRYVAERYDIAAEVLTDVDAQEIPNLISNAQFFMASVHHSIRWPDREPPKKGGHLVLVTAATPAGVTFHNPSGHNVAAQQNATLSFDEFGRFFAGRGIVINSL